MLTRTTRKPSTFKTSIDKVLNTFFLDETFNFTLEQPKVAVHNTIQEAAMNAIEIQTKQIKKKQKSSKESIVKYSDLKNSTKDDLFHIKTELFPSNEEFNKFKQKINRSESI